MDDDTQRRIARNESLLREVNESIERGRWPGDEDRSFRFRCECASLECNQVVEMTRSEYEHLRAHSRWFVLRAGHELPEVETIVSVHAAYEIVEKRGQAGEAAKRLDPRD